MKTVNAVISVIVFLIGIWNIFGCIRLINGGFTIIGVAMLVLQLAIFYMIVYKPIKKLLKVGR